MLDQAQTFEQPQLKAWYLISCVASTSMFVVITVASCTSSETFSLIYTTVAEFLSLSQTTLTESLRTSPSIGHFLCYALLSLSLCGVFSHHNKFLAPLVAGVFGVLMEVVQAFIPSRNSSLLDIAVNVLGIGIGIGIYWLWATYTRGALRPLID